MKPRAQILVAEDDDDVRRMLQQLLGTLGDVTACADGREAYDAMAGGYRPDVLVTDVMMPRMDGVALARAMKSAPQLQNVPVVMLTARTGPRDVIAGINAGARFYVTKPFKAEELLSKVKKALGPR